MTTERPYPRLTASLPQATTTPIVRPDTPRRRVDIAWLRRNGDIGMSTQSIPAAPLFEDCFSAFAHGTPVQTPHGPVAIEDILPGDEVMTVEYGPQPVLWRGSMTCTPHPQDRCRNLTRIMTDVFGIGRPVRDLLLGPAARLLQRPRSVAAGGRQSQALAPICALQDGATVIAVTPPSAVQLYHIALPVHATLCVGGLEMESYHPGISLRSALPHRTLGQFLSLFPHVVQPGDFGPLTYPRLTGDAFDNAPAA